MGRVTRVGLLALLMTVLTAGAAMAGYCKPEPRPLTVAFDGFCGDPRAPLRFDGEGTAKVAWWRGNGNGRAVMTIEVDGPRTLKLWVRNKFSVYDADTGDLLLRRKVKDGPHIGPCPRTFRTA